MSLQVPLQDIIAGHVNEPGVIYDPLRKDLLFAEELDAMEGRLVSGRWSINPFSIACGGTEVLSEDRDGFLRGLVAEGPVGPILKEGPGSRLLWHAGKKAFRVGEVTGLSTAWDDAEIGVGTHAIGTDVRAINDGSIVVGSGVDGANPLTSTAIDEILLGQGSDVPTVRITPASGVGTVGRVGVGLGSLSPTAKLDVSPSTATESGFRLRTGTAPSSPNEGDLWIASGIFYGRLGGLTREISVRGTNYQVATADATPTVIATFTLAASQAILIEARVIGNVSSGGTRRGAYIRRACVYRTGAGVATLQGPVDSAFTRESIGSWDATIAVSGNDAQVVVTGQAGTAINWSCLLTVQDSGGGIPT